MSEAFGRWRPRRRTQSKLRLMAALSAAAGHHIVQTRLGRKIAPPCTYLKRDHCFAEAVAQSTRVASRHRGRGQAVLKYEGTKEAAGRQL